MSGVYDAIKVVISGDAKGAVKAFRETDLAADESGGKFKKFGSMAAAGGLVAVTAAIAVGTALLQAGDKLNRSQDQFRNALKDSHQAVGDYSSVINPLLAQMEHWGFTNDQVYEGLASLVRVGDTVTTATNDMSLAANVARGRNIDLATAEQLIVKVRTGHVALLGRYGIAVKDASGKIIDQNTAIKRLSDMYSGAAATSADSLTGKTEALRAKFQDLKEQIGQKLMPVFYSAVNWFIGTFEPAVGHVELAIARFALHAWQDVAGAFMLIKNIAGDIAGWFTAGVNGVSDIISGAFRGAFNAVISLWDDSVGKIFHGQSYGIGPFSVTLPNLNIPKLHTGGIFESGHGEGLALLRDGEGVFTPQQMRALGSMMPHGSGGGHTYINLPAGIDPAAVVRAQRQHERRNGITRVA